VDDSSLKAAGKRKTTKDTKDHKEVSFASSVVAGFASVVRVCFVRVGLLHRNGPSCFVNVAFAVPCLEDNGVGRF
jgi:hypothetical protein